MIAFCAPRLRCTRCPRLRKTVRLGTTRLGWTLPSRMLRGGARWRRRFVSWSLRRRVWWIRWSKGHGALEGSSLGVLPTTGVCMPAPGRHCVCVRVCAARARVRVRVRVRVCVRVCVRACARCRCVSVLGCRVKWHTLSRILAGLTSAPRLLSSHEALGHGERQREGSEDASLPAASETPSAPCPAVQDLEHGLHVPDHEIEYLLRAGLGVKQTRAHDAHEQQHTTGTHMHMHSSCARMRVLRRARHAPTECMRIHTLKPSARVRTLDAHVLCRGSQAREFVPCARTLAIMR